jgi:polysaccharide biosynthesis protein PslG
MRRFSSVTLAAFSVAMLGTIITTMVVPVARAQSGEPRAAVGFGLRMELLATDNSQALLNAAQIMRADWVAQDVKWKDVETEPGQYHWERLDGLVLAARPYGIRLMMSVSGTPDWARAAADDLNFDGPPASYAQFALFMAALSQRYAGTVAAYEIWPEANIRSRWWTLEGVSPEKYTDFLRQASIAVHTGDPMAIVISGGLAPTGASDNFNVIDDLTFYERMYAAGAQNYFDALGVRVDGYNNPPSDTPQTSSVSSTTYKGHTSFYFRHYEDVRVLMVKYGDTSHNLWITSAGWASSPGVIAGMEYAADTTEQQQSDYLIEAILQAQSQPYIGAIIVNNFNLATIGTSSPNLAYYSLLRTDWSARPAFLTIAQLRQGDAFAFSTSPSTQETRTHILPNWRPRVRYHFQTGQP